MTETRTDRLLTSLLWGAVAAAAQYTMLFLIIVQRIHVRFENDAPVFEVDPRGLIRLTKNGALSMVWVMTVLYGLIVSLVVYRRPRLSRRAWTSVGLLAVILAALAALVEPLWSVIIVANFAVLYPVLRRG